MSARWSPDAEELVEGRSRVMLKAPRGQGTVFGLGKIEVEAHDRVSGAVAIRIQVPVIVLHGAMPLLLGAGALSNYELATPVGAWIPRIAGDRIRDPGIGLSRDQVADRINHRSQQIALDALDLFAEAIRVCENPADIIAVLPLGSYVRFQVQATVERLRTAAVSMHSVPGIGLLELGQSLRQALIELDPVRPAPPALP